MTSAVLPDPFRAIADPTRRAILDLLASGERTASELGAPFPISQPALSQHLRVLRDAGLVRSRKEGRWWIYAVAPEPLRLVHDWVGHCEGFWTDRLQTLGRFLDADGEEGSR